VKQEIVCPKCAEDLRAIYPTDTPFPGEGVKFVPGTALGPFMCDQCGGPIDPGDMCTAFSIFADHIPYFEWESEYVQVAL